jgi:anthranilate phosphoribosyltransferase
MGMQDYIAKIGAGQKTSKDLTWEEAKQATRWLIEGQATPTQIGAFLLAMRLKMESVTELAACTAAAREYVPPLKLPPDLSIVDLPVYAGKRKTFHALVGAAVIAVAGGAAILLHSHDMNPSRPGPASVLAHLGLPTQLTPTQAAEELATKGFAYLDLALYHPPLARFLDLWQELGVRTLFHSVARMLNPVRASAQVVGVTHPRYLEKTAEALSMLGCRQALILRGIEGNPELSIGGATKAVELRDARITPLTLYPKDAGLAPGAYQAMAACSPEQSKQEAELLKGILHNHVRGSQRDWVVLNAALLLYAAGKAANVSAGAKLAQQVLESGAAGNKLAELAQQAQPASCGMPALTNQEVSP